MKTIHGVGRRRRGRDRFVSAASGRCRPKPPWGRLGKSIRIRSPARVKQIEANICNAHSREIPGFERQKDIKVSRFDVKSQGSQGACFENANIFLDTLAVDETRHNAGDLAANLRRTITSLPLGLQNSRYHYPVGLGSCHPT